MSSRNLKAALGRIIVNVHQLTIKKRLHESWEVSKARFMKVRLEFAIQHLHKEQKENSEWWWWRCCGLDVFCSFRVIEQSSMNSTLYQRVLKENVKLNQIDRWSTDSVFIFVVICCMNVCCGAVHVCNNWRHVACGCWRFWLNYECVWMECLSFSEKFRNEQ